MSSRLVALALALAFPVSLMAQSPAPDHWQQLPAIPDQEGFASAFAGVSGGSLLFAGGAHLVGDKWGDTFTKQWYDTIFALDEPTGSWRIAGKLPRPLAYGISITANDNVICLGGSDQERHHTEVFALRCDHDRIAIEQTLPPLPRPLANSCGALVGHTIYLAGGLETPASTEALSIFWALDLSKPQPQWQELPTWPGAPRMLSIAAAHGDSFYLFSGTSLAAGPDGKPVRTYLRDAFRYTPGEGWKKLADLPRATVAAPSPALTLGSSELAIVSGDDGLNVNFAPVKDHPGFPRDIVAYDLQTDTWRVAGPAPFTIATVPCVWWRERFVIPNGEARPRVRTNEVWAFTP